MLCAFLLMKETQKFANMAAKRVAVNYSTENLEPPILSVEEAVRRFSFFEVPAFLYPKQIGDFSKGIKEADQKIISEVLFCLSLFLVHVKADIQNLEKTVGLYLNLLGD